MICKDTLKYLSNKNGKKQDTVIKGECFGFVYNGEKYFQIDTYGRKNRQNPNQKSQQIQLDKRSTTYLINILIEYFDLEIDLKVK